MITNTVLENNGILQRYSYERVYGPKSLQHIWPSDEINSNCMQCRWSFFHTFVWHSSGLSERYIMQQILLIINPYQCKQNPQSNLSPSSPSTWIGQVLSFFLFFFPHRLKENFYNIRNPTLFFYFFPKAHCTRHPFRTYRPSSEVITYLWTIMRPTLWDLHSSPSFLLYIDSQDFQFIQS